MSIVKIVLNINGVDIPVSIDEAKKIFNDLKVVFGNEVYWTPQPRDNIGVPFDGYRKDWPNIDSSKFVD